MQFIHSYFRRYLEQATVAQAPPAVRSASTERLTPRPVSTPPLHSPRDGTRASSERRTLPATDAGEMTSLEANSQHADEAGGKASAVDTPAASSQVGRPDGGDRGSAVDVEVSRDNNGEVNRGTAASEAMAIDVAVPVGISKRSKVGRGVFRA
jgi:hypothetical protein